MQAARNDSGWVKNGKADTEPVKLRTIKITPRYVKMLQSLSTEGWIHVIPSKGRWKVRKHGAERAKGIYDDKEAAIAAAKKYSRSFANPYICIHDFNGNVEQTISE